MLSHLPLSVCSGLRLLREPPPPPTDGCCAEQGARGDPASTLFGFVAVITSFSIPMAAQQSSPCTAVKP
jgi:hypothetical protein